MNLPDFFLLCNERLLLGNINFLKKKYTIFKSLHWYHDGKEVLNCLCCSMYWDVARPECLETHLAGIGWEGGSWNKCGDCIFLVSHQTEIRQRRNNPHLGKSIDINVASCYHVIARFAEFTRNMRNLLENPCTIYIMGIWWNTSSHNLGEVWVQIS